MSQPNALSPAQEVFFFWLFVLILLVVGASTAAKYWSFFIQRLDGIRGRSWSAVSAIVDIVDVAPDITYTRSGGRIVLGWIATLTYFYRNPDLQAGDYRREFQADEEKDARDWAASYKGRTVMVHVDPRDPSRSVLRKEELS
jgi:hypothetical protein